MTKKIGEDTSESRIFLDQNHVFSVDYFLGAVMYTVYCIVDECLQMSNRRNKRTITAALRAVILTIFFSILASFI